MAQRQQTISRTAPSTPSLYDEDFAHWVEQQVRLLKAGDAAALDVANLVEELEGLTKRDLRALGSQLKRIMLHMLKQRHQPHMDSRSSAVSIDDGRDEIADILEQSPSLRRHLGDLMAKNYPRAVRDAAGETDLPLRTFPKQPPFSLAEVLGEVPGDPGTGGDGSPA